LLTGEVLNVTANFIYSFIPNGTRGSVVNRQPVVHDGSVCCGDISQMVSDEGGDVISCQSMMSLYTSLGQDPCPCYRQGVVLSYAKYGHGYLPPFDRLFGVVDKCSLVSDITCEGMPADYVLSVSTPHVLKLCGVSVFDMYDDVLFGRLKKKWRYYCVVQAGLYAYPDNRVCPEICQMGFRDIKESPTCCCPNAQILVNGSGDFCQVIFSPLDNPGIVRPLSIVDFSGVFDGDPPRLRACVDFSFDHVTSVRLVRNIICYGRRN